VKEEAYQSEARKALSKAERKAINASYRRTTMYPAENYRESIPCNIASFYVFVDCHVTCTPPDI
jgi:hypothetical protein